MKVRTESARVVKTGKVARSSRITSATVERLKRAGSVESAKIARDYTEK